MKSNLQSQRAMRALIGKLRDFPEIRKYSLREDSVDKAKVIVRYFYYLNVFWIIYSINNWFENNLLLQRFSSVWPLGWVNGLHIAPEQIVVAVFLFFSITMMAGVFFYRHWVGRLFAFLGILEFVALQYSFGQGRTIEWWYPWLYTSFFFIFLPKFSSERLSATVREKLLLVVWGAQAWFFLIYSMVGLHKLIALVPMVVSGEINIFSSDAFGRTMAYFIVKNNYKNTIFPLLLQYAGVGWLGQLGILYLQLFAWWAIVRPSLQRVWAFGLVLFHLSTILVFGWTFIHMVLLLIILFFDSPFAPKRWSFNDIINDLPVFGFAFRVLGNLTKKFRI